MKETETNIAILDSSEQATLNRQSIEADVKILPEIAGSLERVALKLDSGDPYQFLSTLSRVGLIKMRILNEILPGLQEELERVNQAKKIIHSTRSPRPRRKNIGTGSQPVSATAEEVDKERKILILSDEIVNRLRGRQKELAEIVNDILKDGGMAGFTKEEREQEIINRLYAEELGSGIKPPQDARDGFLNIRRELNTKLETVEIRLSEENIFESEAGSDYLIEALSPFNAVESGVLAEIILNSHNRKVTTPEGSFAFKLDEEIKEQIQEIVDEYQSTRNLDEQGTNKYQLGGEVVQRTLSLLKVEDPTDFISRQEEINGKLAEFLLWFYLENTDNKHIQFLNALIEQNLELEAYSQDLLERQVPETTPASVTPSRRELARRERFKEADSRMAPIIATIVAEGSGFYDIMPPQVFRNLAREKFNRNFTNQIMDNALRGKFIRPVIPPGKDVEHYSLAEQAVLVYITLYGTDFVSTDGRSFVMSVATDQLKQYRKQQQQNRGQNGQRKRKT